MQAKMETDETDEQKQNRERLYAIADALAKLVVLRKIETEDGTAYVLEWRRIETLLKPNPFHILTLDEEDDYDFCDWEDMN